MESASSELEVGKEVMTSNGESSSAILKSPGEKKPVVVRVKRKVSQSPLDAFWLEINEKPAKRALLNFEKLSISGSSANGSSIVEELKSKRVLVQHVQTVQSSEATVDLVQSVVSKADTVEDKTPAAERRHAFKKDNRQNQLSKSRQKQEEVAKSARFEQIWRSRKGRKEEVDEMYNFYEVARVDNVEERSIDVKEQESRDMSLEEQRIMNSFLPLLREFIPSAAEEIESDMQGHMSSQVHADEYVYDYYTVNDDMDVEKENAAWSFPLVQVDDEEFYDVPYESEHDSEDSNAEDNPRNDYPDEISEDEDELESESSSESEEEEDSESKSSSKSEGYSHHGSESSSDDPLYDSEFEGSEADAGNFSDGNEDGEDWRWSYR